MKAIEKMFTPEFRNRLDAVVPFDNLPREVVHRVVEKFVLQLEAQLADRNVVIELSPEAADWLAIKGYDERMGARPLGRVIQETIKRPIADEILFGALKDGGTVRVFVKEGEDELGFDMMPGEVKAKPVKPKASKPKRKPRAKPAAKSAPKDEPKPDDLVMAGPEPDEKSQSAAPRRTVPKVGRTPKPGEKT